jgi:hypothetical protein
MAKDRPPFKGSRLRMAEWVADRPEWLAVSAGPWPSLDGFRSGEPVIWLSPLRDSAWSEFRDEMWRDVGLPWPSPHQTQWWPRGGPQWDGVATVPGTNGRRGVLLAEAKSHIAELNSSIDKKAHPDSRRTIEHAVDEARKYLRGRPRKYWSDGFYQYANRLAWLYYMRAKRGLDAWLLFVYFTGDDFETQPPQDRTFPTDEAEWRPALDDMKHKLGLREPHPLSPWVREVFLNANAK